MAEKKAFAASSSIFFLFETLLLDPDARLLIPRGGYAPITPRFRDPSVIESQHGRDVEIFTFIAHPKALRFGVKGLKRIKLKNKDDNGTTEAWVWRSYHIMRAKVRPLKSLMICCQEKTFEELREAGFIRKSEWFEAGSYYLIDLKKHDEKWNELPPTYIALVELLRRQTQLSYELEQLTDSLGKIRFTSYTSTLPKRKIYREQIERDGAEILGKEIVPCVVYRLANFLPEPVNLKKPKNELVQRLYSVKKELKRITLQVRLVTLALELGEKVHINWIEEKTVNRRGKTKTLQLAEFSGLSLERTSWEEAVNEY